MFRLERAFTPHFVYMLILKSIMRFFERLTNGINPFTRSMLFVRVLIGHYILGEKCSRSLYTFFES